jgi:hypothetical protein
MAAPLVRFQRAGQGLQWALPSIGWSARAGNQLRFSNTSFATVAAVIAVGHPE